MTLHCFVIIKTIEYLPSSNNFWDCRLACFLQQYHRDLQGKEDKFTTSHSKFVRVL